MPTATRRDLHLLIPGLTGPVSAHFQQQHAHPLFCKILSRARFQASAYTSNDQMLSTLFGMSLDNIKDIPVAPLTYTLEGGQQTQARYLLRADPVCLVPGQHSLMLSGGDYLQLQADEVEQIICRLNHHFQGQGIQFEALTPYHWYLLLDQDPQIKTYSYDTVYEQSIEPYMPQGEGRSFWHAWLAEVQMLMHQWPGNLQRQLQNRPMINSVWLWGGGDYPRQIQLNPDWQQVWSNDSYAMALAQQAGIEHAALPEDANELLAQLSVYGRHLVCVSAPPSRDWDEILEPWLEHITQYWLSPLVNAMQQQTIDSITLHTPQGHFYLNRARLRQWWRRSRPLSTWISIHE